MVTYPRCLCSSWSTMYAAILSHSDTRTPLSVWPETMRLVTYYTIIPKLKCGEFFFGTSDWNASAAVAILVQFLAGLFLFLQPRGLATLWVSLQKARGLRDT